jgi:hypothetical protein
LVIYRSLLGITQNLKAFNIEHENLSEAESFVSQVYLSTHFVTPEEAEMTKHIHDPQCKLNP